jgi:hypothetical protein
MNLYFFYAIFPDSILNIRYHSRDDIFSIFTDFRFFRDLEGFFPVDDFLAGQRGFVTIKRRVSNQHFIKNNAKTPPIGKFIIP